MEKIRKVVLSSIISVALGAGVYYITKKRQIRAQEEGKHVPFSFYEAVLKRPFDVVLSAFALLFLSPVMGVTALAVKIKLGTPVFFTQERPGLQEKVFRIFKFRTMTDERNCDGELLPDEVRLTGFGKLLRATSLDELPELINILKGDMSVVGPRPLLVEYLKYYDSRQRHRHDVRPGLTGLAQVSGRNGLSWEEKFEDDVKYVGHITFLGDMKIILDTMKVVVKSEGISSKTSVTMEAFVGKKTADIIQCDPRRENI